MLYGNLPISTRLSRVSLWADVPSKTLTNCYNDIIIFMLAEREGFEPSVPRKGDNGFRDRPVRPLRHLSVRDPGRPEK
jgi:hypothetical protein